MFFETAVHTGGLQSHGGTYALRDWERESLNRKLEDSEEGE